MTAPADQGGTVPARGDDLPDLNFAVTGVRALEHAAVPTLAFRLAIARTGGGPVRSVTLSTTVRIAAGRRRYDADDRFALARLFGQPEQWATSMRPLAWAQLTTAVPPFDHEAEADLLVPCSREPELAVTGYFDAVQGGHVPLDFLFSGTVFHTGPEGRLRTAQISWAKEAAYDLPAGLWHELTGRYFGNASWLRVSRDVEEQLGRHRDRHGHATWDDTLRALLTTGQAPVGATGPS